MPTDYQTNVTRPEVDAPGETEGACDQSLPLNQILFGPPGTGKTCATINEALAILAPEFLAPINDDDPESRKFLKAEFDRFVTAERVRFVTFHKASATAS